MKPLCVSDLLLLIGLTTQAIENKPSIEDSVTVTGIEEASDPDIGGNPKPDLHATAGRTDTRIRFLSERGNPIVDISSGFGIDRATIRRTSENWPGSMLVRLHLSGLESFRADGDEIAVEWPVSSTGENTSRVTLRKGRDEVMLDEKSAYYTRVRIVGGNAGIPLKDGYFEVVLPAKLFEGNPEEITLRWIDFYRN